MTKVSIDYENLKNIKISTEDFCRETGISIEQIINNFGDWDNFYEIAKPLKREI